MGQALAFYPLAALILGFGVLVVTARSTVHSVMFLVADFLCIAALYVLQGAPFLGAIQVVVYAGGIVVLYLFVVMLVNLKRPPEAHQDRRRRGRLGLVVSLVVLVELVAMVAYKYVSPAAGLAPARPMGPDNVAQVGMLLYTDYLIPFELASMLLLVAMVGAIILARREL
jgi:NADH-quinone oxidoreductase subunit J